MMHKLLKLPFDETVLEPLISAETIRYHYGKHHAGYVAKLNDLIAGTEYATLTLKEIILKADGPIFNNASQVYNHDFYFHGLSSSKMQMSGVLTELIVRDFGSVAEFKEAFVAAALGLFGSGWVWLCVDVQGRLLIDTLSNAANPLKMGHTPLMTCDVWEHAYYIDYRNARPDYVQKWWELINWEFVSKNLDNHLKGYDVEFPCDDYSGACGYHE
jgi:Fe-Mn family superoxide dismutase